MWPGFKSNNSTLRRLDPSDGSILEEKDRCADLLLGVAGDTLTSGCGRLNGNDFIEWGRRTGRCQHCEVICWDISTGSPERKWRHAGYVQGGVTTAPTHASRIWITDTSVWLRYTEAGSDECIILDRATGEYIDTTGPLISKFLTVEQGPYIDTVSGNDVDRYDADGNLVDTFTGVSIDWAMAPNVYYNGNNTTDEITEVDPATLTGTDYSVSDAPVALNLEQADDNAVYQGRKAYKLGSLLWTMPSIAASQFVWPLDGYLFRGSSGGNEIVRINPATGATIWTMADNDPIISASRVIGSVFYWCPTGTPGRVVAVDMSDGSTLWDIAAATNLGRMVFDIGGDPWVVGARL